MRRTALADTTLFGGTFLRRGSDIMVAGLGHWDPDIYERSNEWDGWRFYRLRQQPGNENAYQAVVTSEQHVVAFGHGQLACPGRFFAVNEIKVTMTHMLMKYDWKMVPGTTPRVRSMATQLFADSQARIEVRRRVPDIDLDTLEVA